MREFFLCSEVLCLLGLPERGCYIKSLAHNPKASQSLTSRCSKLSPLLDALRQNQKWPEVFRWTWRPSEFYIGAPARHSFFEKKNYVILHTVANNCQSMQSCVLEVSAPAPKFGYTRPGGCSRNVFDLQGRLSRCVDGQTATHKACSVCVSYCRRKFRSQTSDNMDRWEKKRWEESEKRRAEERISVREEKE